MLSIAAHTRGRFPDDLRKVAPFLEIGHVGLGLVARIELHLIVVHLIRDHLVNLVIRRTSTDVLTISATAGFDVVCVLTA